MGFRLQRLEAAGFRGINRRLALDIGVGLTVLLGRNGSGKTSLLQAIEWGLFGGLDLGAVAEIRREDAIVNSFATESRARVRLTLSDGTRILQVTRERRLGRSTTARADVTLSVDRETWRNERAAAELERLLGLTTQTFHSAVYLRQEAIAALVGGSHEDRAATLDRLLGLTYLRELIEGIQPVMVQRELNRLERQIEQEEATGTSTAMHVRRLLSAREQELGARGLAPAQLSTSAVTVRLARVSDRLTEAATLLGLPSAELPAAPADRLAAARVLLRQVRQRRDEALNVTHRRRAELSSQIDRLKAAAQAPTDESPANETRLAHLQAEVGTMDLRLHALRRTAEALRVLVTEAREAVPALTAAEQRLTVLQAEAGTEEQVDATLVAVQAELERVTAEGKEKRVISQLLNDALEALEASKHAVCPVCGRPVDQQTLVRRLRAEIESDREARELEALRQRYRHLDGRRRQAMQAREALARAADEVQRLGTAEQALRERAVTICQEPLTGSLDTVLANKLDTLRQEEAALERQRTVLATELRPALAMTQEREARHLALKVALQALGTTLTEVEATAAGAQSQPRQPRSVTAPGAGATSSSALEPADGAALGPEPLLRRAGEQQQRLEHRITQLETLGPLLDAADDELRQVGEALEYLNLRATVERLEAAGPASEERALRLRSAHERLTGLAAGLAEIRDVAVSQRQALLEHSLTTLLPLLNDYYQRLGGHPAFSSLTIQSEQQRGSPVYRLLASDPTEEHPTFIHTRFSRTQTHVAALATFLALARRLPHHLDLLLLDDPAQSMDVVHQEALAAVLALEAEHRQVIVATEDERLSGALRQAAHDRCDVIQLGAWTAAGTRLQDGG